MVSVDEWGPESMGAYLLAFYRNGEHSAYKHARHYLGWSHNIRKRVESHRAGGGARLCKVVVEAGYQLKLVRTWPGPRELEQILKGQHSGVRLCPLCTWKVGETPGEVEIVGDAA